MSTTYWQSILFVALLFGVVSCASARSVCSKKEAFVAETEAVKLRSWDEIYASYKKFYHCDDGAIAEGYSESITNMLENQWTKLPRVQSLIQKNKHFKNFILRHIDETISQDRLASIMKNARDNCPAIASTTCAAIIERLKAF